MYIFSKTYGVTYIPAKGAYASLCIWLVPGMEG
jgi:hypothetical protein